MNADYDRDRIKDISRTDVKLLIIDLVELLHKDCGQKVELESLQHTAQRFSEILFGAYASWYWGDIRRVCNNGITGAYSTRGEKINFQTLATWMKRALRERGTNYSEKEIQDNRMLNAVTVGDFGNLSSRWREFREFLENNGVWFMDNISLSNCNKFHEAVRTDNLREFLKMMVTEPDPAYFEKMRKMTLEEFKRENEHEFD